MKIKRNDRFIFLMSLLLTFSFILLAVYIIVEEFGHIESVYEKDLYNIANIIADDEVVIEKIKSGDNSLDTYVDKYYENVEDLSLIIILDMNNIRYAHPNDVELGNECDQIEVSDIYNGEPYIGSYVDENNVKSIRAFVPIYDGDTQIGVASTGILQGDVNALKLSKTTTILLAFGFGLIVSLVSLTWLLNRFKSELLGFAPTEIALLYAENKSVIEQLNEAVISVDDNYKITTLNKKAKKMFDLSDSIIGKDAEKVISFIDFKTIIDGNEYVVNKYRKINDDKLLMNAFPLYLEDKIIGATAVFRSHLEVDSLVDQITGYQQMSVALRSQKHEFQNKLHVVLGLIKMKDYEKAENYIMENVYKTNLASDYYTSRLKDDRILALFIGKEIQSKQFNAQLLLTSDSYLTKVHNPINSDDIVIVLGNLIDNSFEAYVNKDMENKRIVVDIFEDEEKIKITVIDQAGGVDPEVINNMFERGVSTKNGDSRGTGLSLVGEIVNVYSGEKTVQSSEKETKIEIILMKVNL
ncbi:ATP-binding protein [Candidatus Izimaplasma bacterium HR1]|uniref:ATP-binding protein n=1 Tax=Candidatus Izimoplasma sp. HR1 TaxID=1541959 RepID=UPI0005718B8C